jgi:hypothetical protein
LNGIADDP